MLPRFHAGDSLHIFRENSHTITLKYNQVQPMVILNPLYICIRECDRDRVCSSMLPPENVA
jgi:hypothetical protein